MKWLVSDILTDPSNTRSVAITHVGALLSYVQTWDCPGICGWPIRLTEAEPHSMAPGKIIMLNNGWLQTRCVCCGLTSHSAIFQLLVDSDRTMSSRFQILICCRASTPQVDRVLEHTESTRTWVWMHEEVFNLLTFRLKPAHSSPIWLEPTTFRSQVLHSTSYATNVGQRSCQGHYYKTFLKC